MRRSRPSLCFLVALFLFCSSFCGSARAQDVPDMPEAPLQADLLPGLDIQYVRAAIVLLPAQRTLRGSVAYHVERRVGADSLILRAGAVSVKNVFLHVVGSRTEATPDSSDAPTPPWTHRSDTLRIALPAATDNGSADAGPVVFVVQIDYETARVGYDVRDRSGWKAVWTPSRPDAAHWIPQPLAWSDPFAADIRVKTPPGWNVYFPAGSTTRLPGPDHAIHVWQPSGERLTHGLGFLAMDVDAVLEQAPDSSQITIQLPEGHPSHYWPGLVLLSDDMELETDPLMGRFKKLTLAERTWAAPLATNVYWTDSWLHEAAVAWRALEALRVSEGPAAAQRVLEEARRRYLAEPYRRPLVWDRWHSPVDLEDAHARWKGLWVLHMLAERTSPSAVHSALDAVRLRALDAPIDTEDFRQAMENEWDLTAFFDTWAYSAGHPQLSVIHTHAANSGQLTVMVEQKQAGPFIPPAFDLDGELLASSIAGSEARAFRSAERSTRVTMDMPVRPRYVHFRSRVPLLMEFVPPPDEVDVTAWIRDAETDQERVALLATLAEGEPGTSLLIGLRAVLEAAPDNVRVAAFPVLAAMAPSESALRLVHSLSVPTKTPSGDPLPDLLYAKLGALEAFGPAEAAALALETANTSQNGFLLERAVHLLVTHRPDLAWQVLESALVTRSDDDRIRRLAIRLVEASGRSARERLAALLPLTENPHHPTTRGEALLAAARVDPKNSTVRRRTAAWLPDEHPTLRAAAIEALDVLPEDAVPTAAITDALERETRPALRRALLRVLSNRDA